VSWLLETDVICQPAKKAGDPEVIAWLDAEQERCYTSAVVIAQLAYWVRTKDGRQRQLQTAENPSLTLWYSPTTPGEPLGGFLHPDS
jgi:predicted nucleic acid-binding protein